MAVQIFKDPYIFDFLGTDTPRRELDIEKALTAHVEKFLLELGQGFAFVGRQMVMEVGDSEFRLDLLFYHLKLRCYVVIELKAGKLEPGHISQLGFYVNVVDDILRTDEDKPTIGLLLVKEKNRLMAEYCLKSYLQPLGIAEWQYELHRTLPAELMSSLPTIEEIEAELGQEMDLPLQLSELGRSRSVPLALQPVGAVAGLDSGGLAADTLTVQEKLVIQYLQSHDSMTVKVVGELLSVKDSRAREILKALTDRGLLRKQGTARSTYYVRV
jgi:hypothetical protein